MKRPLLLLAILAMAACTTPARILVPDDDSVEAGKKALEQLTHIPPPQERVRIGDQLRIVRDAGEMPSLSAINVSTIYELTLFTVLNDGTIYYPFVGNIKAAGRTPGELAQVLTQKLRPIYRQPDVTVNINQTQSNAVFVGGAVRSPTAVPIPLASTADQAIIGAGGMLSSADARKVALLREDQDGAYKTYFFDYSRLLADGGHHPLRLQRGDVLFVPKSTAGNHAEGADLYINQLLPFAKSIGVGATYNFNEN